MRWGRNGLSWLLSPQDYWSQLGAWGRAYFAPNHVSGTKKSQVIYSTENNLSMNVHCIFIDLLRITTNQKGD